LAQLFPRHQLTRTAEHKREDFKRLILKPDPGVLTTIDPALVMAIARGASSEYSTLLGRAIAHELGHLLLGRSRHSSNGLMRAVWSQEEIRGTRPAGWQFSTAEAAQMRQGLASRTRAAN
jgi:hypothetical protein